ncbi:restriction system-associated AAA family ATPase [Pyxidicoccus parkwayensis]|uniref:Restriction system-associated AAA family ATPase n=1 Tax=Pyxidicoccus parkwayensis TaxID=2813578 RepID=A0ABX7PAX5_9BACT|nr:restriction system-associated AAA family ATPase [Pyxidicoccus parkwaysis]QSQ27602.1 restriction system-associated AAA family ATPase [Pyxidicoccus parkwaysis]
MKLTRVHIIKAATCGGLLDGLEVGLRGALDGSAQFDPLCLVGPNGAGKSQFLQVIAEAFQTVFHACMEDEERAKGNDDLQFEFEYFIRPAPTHQPVLVRLSRSSDGKRRPTLSIQRKDGFEWANCPLTEPDTRKLLPSRIIAYTSGDNETLSLPFLVSRSGYADAVGKQALAREPSAKQKPISDTRLMLVDYGTHLEVLVANLLLGAADERAALLRDAKLKDIHSFRCVIQLAHRAVPRLSARATSGTRRKGVQLTEELERYIDQLKRCSTCHSYDEKSETYIFDFLVNEQTREAFRFFWQTTIELYSALHKLSMLNDLAIPKVTRERLMRDIKTRRFASRLPEPQDEDRVFRFEQVRFMPKTGEGVVDYVSLSDGEHQLAQILGTMCMASFSNALFLLDEPESHFNPQWRVKFISRLMELPTANGKRGETGSAAAQQDCLLTTHSPFVPSDMARENVLIFKRDGQGVKVRRPGIETFGTTFDTILEECFDVRPPMSEVPRREIEELMRSQDRETVKAGIARLGDSVEKVFLMDHLRQLSQQEGA